MIGIDLGGTRIKGVLINKEGRLLLQSIRPTRDDGTGAIWKNAVREIVDDLSQKEGGENCTVGISAPGLPDEAFSAIAFMPGRMQGLERFNWSEFLGRATYVLNDGVAALVAEARFGAARGKRNALMVTLGTGVGGAILIDGKPYGGLFNKAGHIGHIVVDHMGEPDITNMPGSLEGCIGNCTIEKRSGGRFASTRDLLDAHRSGDTSATEIWMRSVRQLALGLASASNLLSPEVIVVGGGITAAGDDLFLPLRDYMGKFEWRPGGSFSPIVEARFGEAAGAMGAACFAAERGQPN